MIAQFVLAQRPLKQPLFGGPVLNDGDVAEVLIHVGESRKGGPLISTPYQQFN